MPSQEEGKPTKLAIGGEGGFAVGEDRYEITKQNELVCIGSAEPWVSVPLPCPELPEMLIEAARALIDKKSVLAEEATAAVAWEIDVKESRCAATTISSSLAVAAASLTPLRRPRPRPLSAPRAHERARLAHTRTTLLPPPPHHAPAWMPRGLSHTSSPTLLQVCQRSGAAASAQEDLVRPQGLGVRGEWHA